MIRNLFVSLAPILSRVRGYAVAVVIAYLLILLAARLFESKLIFFPDMPGQLTGDWQPSSLPIEQSWITTKDRVKLHAWWIPNYSADFTIIAFHGNAGNIADRIDVYRFLWQLRANVFAVEYRGYGRSEGAPSENGLYLDAEAAYDYLIRVRGVSPESVVSFGQSLGTAVATDLATKRKVAGLILEAPFPSIRAVAGRVFPHLPGLGLVAKSRFETGRKIAQLDVPVFVVQCTNDPVIPPRLGEEVYRAAREPKFFLRSPGTCHEEASLMAPDLYRARLETFLELLRARHRQ